LYTTIGLKMIEDRVTIAGAGSTTLNQGSQSAGRRTMRQSPWQDCNHLAKNIRRT
jgi:hypothetical protein